MTRLNRLWQMAGQIREMSWVSRKANRALDVLYSIELSPLIRLTEEEHEAWMVVRHALHDVVAGERFIIPDMAAPQEGQR